ncbi:hypothetical protein KOW79_000067 [Hemibagrus wyckioides]|uniref:RRM domain-containing protein n=1 Tax=Hemibagrus wyckioides TaxID=337641 RepID=A0A9D3MZV5_9TELE|nr:hypothetical protein KOW79_000067 [Hemibagrus wyckioides]
MPDKISYLAVPSAALSIPPEFFQRELASTKQQVEEKRLQKRCGIKRFGYVQYESAEAAALAIERLNGKLLNDRQVTIEYFRSWEERKVEVCRAEEAKVEVRRAEEAKVEARKAEEPKVEARKFIKKIDLTIHRKCLRRAPPLLYNDTVQSTKASASEDISQIVYTAASQMVQAAGSPAPVNNVEAVETAGPENSEESVETAASEGSVEAVKTVASDDRVEAVEATAPVEATETAAPEETLEAVSEIRVPAPLQHWEIYRLHLHNGTMSQQQTHVPNVTLGDDVTLGGSQPGSLAVSNQHQQIQCTIEHFKSFKHREAEVHKKLDVG